MKNLLLLLALSLITQYLAAQACLNSQSSIEIHGNNIQARILNGGDLFTDLVNAQFIPNPNPNSFENPATIFAAGIWMGGIDPGGNLKLAAVDYRSNNKYDYTPGPLDPNGITSQFNCSNWDRHFRITGAQVAAFQAALPLSAAELKTQFPNIAGWPGRGNPFFTDIYGYSLPSTGQALAPFFDVSQDGIYNPLDGDYPVVQLRGIPAFVPAEIIWCVFNDQNGGGPHSTTNGKAFQVEIQLTTWAFNCPNQAVVNNTLFTSHKIINRASEPTDSTFIGIWADVDLGCGLDDYVGCDTSLNTMYAYNTDAVDGQPGNTCQGTPTFPDAAPTQSVTFLNHTLDKFIPINGAGSNIPTGTTDPGAPYEYYRYLTGTWRDGSPLTDGPGGYGSGNHVDHVYTDDPSNPSGWSMCTASLPTGDRRLLGTTKIGQLLPGQIEEMTVAWAFHPNPSLPCGIGTTRSDVAKLHTIYENGFSDLCLPLKVPELPADSLQLFPNPTSGTALLRYGTLTPLSLRAFDAAGRMVLEKTNGFGKEETKIETGSFASGIYTLQIVTNQGTATKKLAVLR
ncbi:MAG: T9SS type A sorting domain-containing protein [Phycisphaerae bacterium]|nr:T9SS type A sorting domain-containing protein [Saprospiraceae bacterium]